MKDYSANQISAAAQSAIQLRHASGFVTNRSISSQRRDHRMEFLPSISRRASTVAALAGFMLALSSFLASAGVSNPGTNEIRIKVFKGKVEISPTGATTWVRTQTDQILYPLDRLRTGTNSQAAIIFSGPGGQSVVRLDALTELEILAPQRDEDSGLQLLKGLLSFFHRDKPGRIRVITRGAVAGVEGTEFVISVDPNDGERTTLSVIDGKVRFANSQGELLLTNGEQATASPAQPPQRTPGFIAENLLQWCFYYPAILDLRDFPLTPEEQALLTNSIAAYRSGDLLAALANYPQGRKPISDSERIYYAALLLSVGQINQTETILTALSASDPANHLYRLANSLHQLIAAVKHPAKSTTPLSHNRAPSLATELLAESYYQQSLARREISLTNALALAQQATAISPQFGFAWERLAELEFSFGHTTRALDALNKSLALSPRNAQALALKGFLFAAQNKMGDAIGWFDQAIAVDSALGNAWLGRGLCRIRRGDTLGGREDLLIAAALEPQRAALRSYLGKAYANERDFSRATKELELAKQMDPHDPTSWLYSALTHEQQNRINEAIRDLEKSQELNDNRSVYRSGFLLDQDRAVRSANLARVYQEAGMEEVSLREASKAVNADYANYSAHLFLADSYNALLDPNRINLRYETPSESEYLLANLLAPVGAGTLSPTISQQEYSRLFERDRFGFSSSTEYLSRGAWTQTGAQYGTVGNFSYDIEGFYRADPGQRANNDFEERVFSFQIKQQLTPRDTVYLLATDYDANGGDLLRYYNQTNATLGLRIEEKQRPIVALGYHHEWTPGVHTLFLASRLSDNISVFNPRQGTFFLIKSNGVTPSYVQPITLTQDYESTLEIHSFELQQIWQHSTHNTVVGGRFQTGEFHTENLQTDPQAGNSVIFFDPDNPAARQDYRTGFERLSLYGYHFWQVASPLLLIGGLSYDQITFPEDFRAAPISKSNERAEQVSPKAGLIVTPLEGTTIRAAYTRSLAGASIDQSFQLEPSQVAGFLQSFRSIIPESVIGAEAGARFETFGLSLEQKFRTRTYIGLSGEILNSKINRSFGVFEYDGIADWAYPAGTRERIDYQEKSLRFTVNQLIGEEWALGIRYRLSQADLKDDFKNIPGTATFVGGFRPRQQLQSTLHQLTLDATYNHPSGFFGKLQGLWYLQNNRGYARDIRGDDFWHFNAFVGCHFSHRRGQITLGLLNITDQDYRLNPLNLYNELPRERTLATSLHFNF